MQEKRKIFLADGALLLAALIWGADYIVVKVTLGEISPLFLTALRFSASFFILLGVFWRRVRKTNIKVVFAGILVGVFMFGGFALLTVGLQYTTASKSAFLTSVSAIIVPFLSWLFYRRFPGVHALIGAAVCILGVALLSLSKSISIGIGDLLTLGCALCFALNIISVAHFVKTMDVMVITVAETGISAVLALIGALIFERPFRMFGLQSGLGLIYLTLLGTLGTHLLANIGLKHTSPVHGGIIITTEAAFAAIFSYFLLKELFTGKMIIGCVLIFSAILITVVGPNLFLKRLKKQEKKSF